jgi:hypothetical protein
MSQIQRLRQNMQDLFKANAGDWLEKIPVITGKRDGVTVDAGYGRIWVRFDNGQEKTVLNTSAPIGFDRHILVGRLKSQPAVWRVAETRENYLQSASQYQSFHHTQHEFDGPDRVIIDRKQIRDFTVLVSDAANFIVQVYGGQYFTSTGMLIVDDQQIDLSSYIPATGAVYVNIVIDDTDGTLLVVAGTGFLDKDNPAITDAPIPAIETTRIAMVLLFELMEELLDDYIYVPTALETNQANFAASGYANMFMLMGG